MLKPTKIIRVWNFSTGYVTKNKLMSGDILIKEISKDELKMYNLPIFNRYQ
jgi:hypothetical protein